MKISIATEDILTEEIMIKVISSSKQFDIGLKLGKQGNGYLVSKLNNFNELAKNSPVIVVFDLDLKPCPEKFRTSLENKVINKRENLHLIVSVREIESWILADRVGFSSYFKVSKDKIERDPDELLDPKEKIINLAKQSKDSVIKKGIPPANGAAAKVGLSYNSLLTGFIRDEWDMSRAAEASPSLSLAIKTITGLLQVGEGG
ncbi:DUF4276 family protein [Edwardsiella piscicida]|uniref:DUF4276 family protein n=1 Tax=Edwardsiella piscicida TaxID=1263550 RepID=UPI000D51C926|nr:DUF4276 family protein [Edwardsiella piscicida]UCQ37509.1 DUF4276 family protein [Edwardsiella piscicida]